VVVSAEAEMPGAGRREPTTTLTGWRRFVDSAPASFNLLVGAQWQALSSEQRSRYDEARINYHCWILRCDCTATGPAPCPDWGSTCISAPAG
jgi:hypothetical protein